MASNPTRKRIRAGSDEFERLVRCTSQKVSARSYGEALSMAERMMNRGAVNPGCHITPYLCEECGEFHVWNKPIVFEAAT